MGGDRRLRVRGVVVVRSLPRAERRLEPFPVQVDQPDVVTGGGESRQHPVTGGADQRVLVWVAVHDQGALAHLSAPRVWSTRSRNAARSASVAVSIEYRPSQVSRGRARHADIRSARDRVRRPPSAWRKTWRRLAP